MAQSVSDDNKVRLCLESQSLHGMMCLTRTDSNVLICDFHRKQAWLRWVTALKNNVAHEKDHILQLLNVSIQHTQSLAYPSRNIGYYVNGLSVCLSSTVLQVIIKYGWYWIGCRNDVLQEKCAYNNI